MLQESGSLAAHVAQLLERVDYRRADTWEEKEKIFRLRYEAYSREGNIEPNPTGLFMDPEDEEPNAWLIGIYIDGLLASSIRLHIASKPEHYLPVAKVFPDIIIPRLAAGEVIIDATRLTSRLEFARAYPFLPYVPMRTAFLAEDHFNADFITAAFRPEYQGAYRRMYGAEKWCESRPYPPLAKPQVLMAYDCHALRGATRARYPFLRSSSVERETLYARSSTSAGDRYEGSAASRLARRAGGKQHSTTCVA